MNTSSRCITGTGTCRIFILLAWGYLTLDVPDSLDSILTGHYGGAYGTWHRRQLRPAYMFWLYLARVLFLAHGCLKVSHLSLTALCLVIGNPLACLCHRRFRRKSFSLRILAMPDGVGTQSQFLVNACALLFVVCMLALATSSFGTTSWPNGCKSN